MNYREGHIDVEEVGIVGQKMPMIGLVAVMLRLDEPLVFDLAEITLDFDQLVALGSGSKRVDARTVRCKHVPWIIDSKSSMELT